MPEPFRAIVIRRSEDTGRQSVGIENLRESDLMPGDTLVAVEHSTVNYKDGLAITGRSPVVRRFPMVPGVDFAGRVIRCTTGVYSPGDRVILNGFGVGETHFGGYARLAQVKADWLIPLPRRFTTAEAMTIGTAGYTSALAVRALLEAGLTASDGDVLVTGAAGGVGSIAVALLRSRGFRVVAASRRAEAEHDFLMGIGAAAVMDAREIASAGRPLAKERWAAAIDSVGSHTLANVLAQTRYRGTVAACGLAQGPDLPGTVMPFILRGVTLRGIDSVQAPRAERIAAWSMLEADLDRGVLSRLGRTIMLDDVIGVADEIVEGRIKGRVVVEIDPAETN